MSFFCRRAPTRMPGHHRNHVAQVRNRSDETFVHVAEMHVQIFSARRSPGFGHVLRKDFARPNAFHKTAPRSRMIGVMKSSG